MASEKELSILSVKSYEDYPVPPPGWEVYSRSFGSKGSGLYYAGVAFRNSATNEVVIAHPGTDGFGELQPRRVTQTHVTPDQELIQIGELQVTQHGKPLSSEARTATRQLLLQCITFTVILQRITKA